MADAVNRRTFVLDTSVLLADPLALLRFDEHVVVLPVVVPVGAKTAEAFRDWKSTGT